MTEEIRSKINIRAAAELSETESACAESFGEGSSADSTDGVTADSPLPAGKSAQTSSLAQKQPTITASTTFDQYEIDCVATALQSAVATLSRANKHSEADIASRLLIDLHDHRVSAREAEQILAKLDKSIVVHKKRGADAASVLAAATALFVIVASSIWLTGSIVRALSSSRMPTTDHMLTAPRDISAVPENWQYLPVGELSTIQSLNGYCKTDFHITNRTKGPVRVYWINYWGERVEYMQLQPGQTQTQSTFATHPWLVVDEREQPVMLFIAGSKPDEEVAVKTP